MAALSDKEKQGVDFGRIDKLAILADVLAAVDNAKQLCIEKRWKYRKGNREIIIRDQLEKVAVWVKKFIEVGDAAAQYDPGHASLPWAGVRFLLQVIVMPQILHGCRRLMVFAQIAINDCQTFGAMIEGVERVSSLITRYDILEKLYLLPTTAPALAREQLEKSIVKLYSAMLKYLSKAGRYYSQNTASAFIYFSLLMCSVADVIHRAGSYVNYTHCGAKCISLSGSDIEGTR